MLPSWDPDAFVEAVTERGGTHTAVVPTMIARLLSHSAPAGSRCRGLRMLGYAGAPMPPEQMRQAYERLTPNLVQYYGLVEAIPPVTVLDAADHARGLAASRRCSARPVGPRSASRCWSSTRTAARCQPARWAR